MTHNNGHFTSFFHGELDFACQSQTDHELNIDYLTDRLMEVAAGYGGSIESGLVEIAGELEISLGTVPTSHSTSTLLAAHLAASYTEAVTAFLAKHR